MKNNFICAVDIGSSKIAGVVAEIKNRAVVNLFFDHQPSKGVRRGSVVDSIELVESLGTVLKNLKAKSGFAVKAVHANISGSDIVTRHSRALIPLAERGNKVIMSLDVERVNQQAAVLGSTMEEEIIHRIPYSYSVDGKADIACPLGLYGHKLEVDLYLIAARLAPLQTIIHALHQAGVDTKEVFVSAMATAQSVCAQEMKKGTVVLCDIGSDITELLLLEDGNVRDIRIIAAGGNDLTAGLAESLAIPLDLAEEIKLSHGAIVDPLSIKENKEALIKKDNMFKPIKQREVAEIINRNAAEFCRCLKEQAEKLVALPEIDHLLVSGRAILQDGLLELMESQFGFRLKIAKINEPQLAGPISSCRELSGRKYLMYATALGLLCNELYGYHPQKASSPRSGAHPLAKVFHKIQEIYLEYF